MKILNYGSLNIDYVYHVPHITRPGETQASSSFDTFAGGKGANQSVALARAGATVFHAGKTGKDAGWLIEKLSGYGVDTRFVHTSEGATGHAIIQVDEHGENSIILFPGGNKNIERREVDETLSQFEKGDTILLQNEINDVAYIIKAAHEQGLKVCFNPAPFTAEVPGYPLNMIDTLILNETEAAGLAAGSEQDPDVLCGLWRAYPRCAIILTLGANGAKLQSADQQISVPAVKVSAVDTTAAGDTFIGFYLAELLAGKSAEGCLKTACAAAAIAVTRQAAMDSIPSMEEVEALMRQRHESC